MKTYQQMDAREAKQFWSEIWQPREHNKNAHGISNMARVRTWRRTKSKNTHRFTQNNSKKISYWKIPGHDGFWFKKFPFTHDRLA